MTKGMNKLLYYVENENDEIADVDLFSRLLLAWSVVPVFNHHGLLWLDQGMSFSVHPSLRSWNRTRGSRNTVTWGSRSGFGASPQPKTPLPPPPHHHHQVVDLLLNRYSGRCWWSQAAVPWTLKQKLILVKTLQKRNQLFIEESWVVQKAKKLRMLKFSIKVLDSFF